MSNRPSIGRVVIYRSRTGDYSIPAIINATMDTLSEKGVAAGHVPPLQSDSHVHLTVFTPGRPGMRRDASDFQVESEFPRSENVAGCYQEWDIGQYVPALDPAGDAFWAGDYDAQPPGTWAWPPRVS